MFDSFRCLKRSNYRKVDPSLIAFANLLRARHARTQWWRKNKGLETHHVRAGRMDEDWLCLLGVSYGLMIYGTRSDFYLTIYPIEKDWILL